MRIYARSRGFGERLGASSTLKLKGLQVVPKASDISTATDATGWGKMWSNFDWSGWLKPQIDLAKANGANCVKVTASAATSDYPAWATLQTRIAQFINYAASLEMLVYWNFASSDWGGSLGAASTGLTKIAGYLDTFPNVVALDVANEVSEPSYLPLATAQSLFAVARAVTTIPLTASRLCHSSGALTDSTVQALAPYVDFYDFHPYYSSGNAVTADFTSLRAAPYYKRWLVGECGEVLSSGSSVQQARWAALGTLSGASDSWGAFGFCIADYDPATQFGMYPSTLTGVRTQLSTPFAAWPSSL